MGLESHYSVFHFAFLSGDFRIFNRFVNQFILRYDIFRFSMAADILSSVGLLAYPNVVDAFE